MKKRDIIEELIDFIPEKLFDIHAHIYSSNLEFTSHSFFKEGPKKGGIKNWRNSIEKYVGKGKLVGGLFTPLPFSEIFRKNEFLIEELKKNPLNNRGLIIVSPCYPLKTFMNYLKYSYIVGFKPYHLLSKRKNTFQSSIQHYIPEWVWEIANEKELIIFLHIVKDLALSDPNNQKEIIEKCTKYPKAKLILAHAGRAFNYLHTVKGIHTLRGLQNIWFDTSSICEPFALVSILEEFGPKKLLWGSDFPISQNFGKGVSCGEGFVWITKETFNWNKMSPQCKPIPILLESLLSLKEVAKIFGLNKEDLKDIFFNNSMKLLSLKEEPQNKTNNLYLHAKKRIPGGTQLLSKRPELYAPNLWPAYFSEARGCEVWDIDGKHYYDFSINGIGCCLLGFRDPDVTMAVKRCINLGSMSSLNPPEEVELADLLCEIHPWAEQVRFVRTGGEACAVAIRIARATTNRTIVAICGYHGWHDWYLAVNLFQKDALKGHLLPGLEPAGVPKELANTAIPFHYNNKEEFEDIIKKYGDRIAAVIMEPCRTHPPNPGFLEFVRDGIHSVGGLLIFDEITIGWRLCYGGAHLKFGVNPDLAVFAKAMGNGHPIGAIIGTKKAMEGANISFISSSYWTESVGPVAALATLKKLKKLNVPVYISEIGSKVQKIWNELSRKNDLPIKVDDGYPCLANFKFEHPFSMELKTLFTQLMLERGFLAGTIFYPTYAHTDKIIYLYEKAVAEVFREIFLIIRKNEIKERLKGEVAHTGFSRLT